MEERTNLSKEYQQNFHLDEGKLRKIVDILTQNMQRTTIAFELVFEINRFNNTTFKTRILDDILGDDNTKGKEIKSLTIKVTETSPENRYIGIESLTNCNVKFAHPKYEWSESEVTFSIGGKDKGWCLMLAEDLDTQIRRALVNTNKHLVTIISFVDFLLPIILVSFLFFLSAYYFEKPKPHMTIDIESLSLEQKVNKILEFSQYNTRREISIYYIVAGLLAIVAIVVSLVGLFQEFKPFNKMSKWFNRSVFYWGDQIPVYDRYVRLAQNVRWTIIIGFIVSLCAGILVALFQK